MSMFHLMLSIFALVALIGLAIAIRWERRRFVSRGLAGPWLAVRLSSIPAIVLTAMLVIAPARHASGMGALAAFYALLLTVAPMAWFGVHLAVGRLVKPQLSFGDAAQIAGLPLAYALALAAAAPAAQHLAWRIPRLLGVE